MTKLTDAELAEIRERQRHVAESPVIDGTKIDRLVRKDVPKLLDEPDQCEILIGQQANEMERLREIIESVNQERLGYIKTNKLLKRDLEQAQKEADDWQRRNEEQLKRAIEAEKVCDEWKAKAEELQTFVDHVRSVIPAGWWNNAIGQWEEFE